MFDPLKILQSIDQNPNQLIQKSNKINNSKLCYRYFLDPYQFPARSFQVVCNNPINQLRSHHHSSICRQTVFADRNLLHTLEITFYQFPFSICWAREEPRYNYWPVHSVSKIGIVVLL